MSLLSLPSASIDLPTIFRQRRWRRLRPLPSSDVHFTSGDVSPLFRRPPLQCPPLQRLPLLLPSGLLWLSGELRPPDGSSNHLIPPPPCVNFTCALLLFKRNAD